MRRELIEIPDWNNNNLYYITKIEEYLNTKRYSVKSYPNYTKYGILHCLRYKQRKESNYFFSKFIYKDKNEIDPLRRFNNLIKRNKKDCFLKFIENKEDVLTFVFNKNKYSIKVYYISIRQPIVSFIKQKFGNCEAYKELNNLFSFTKKSKLSFDKYLTKKSKYLLSLNYEGFIKELNKKAKEQRVLL